MLDALISRQQAGLRVPRATPSAEPRALPGEIETTAEGPLRIRRRYFEPDHRHGAVAVAAALPLEASALAALAGDRRFAPEAARRPLFLDTETTGLAGGTGTLAFLTGLGWFEDGGFVVEQLFLSRPGEERPMLLRLRERLAQSTLLVTFNGKSYDWPLLKSRFLMNRLDPPPVPAHLDLLSASRRVFRERLGGVRLVRLEEEVLGFRRERDVEGHEIPSLYWSYVRGKAAPELPIVFEHNQNDVVAMAALLARLQRAYLEPEPREDPRDHLGYARLAHRAQDLERACEFAVRAARGGASPEVALSAYLLGARLLVKAQRVAEAEALLASALSEWAEPPPALHLVLAKLYEHRLKEPAKALAHARRSAAAEPSEQHERRLSRLERRLASAQRA